MKMSFRMLFFYEFSQFKVDILRYLKDIYAYLSIKQELLVPVSSLKHLHTKVTPDFHLKYSKNGGNLGSESK